MAATGDRTLINVKGPQSIRETEGVLEQIHSAGPDADLLSPTDLSERHFAGTAAYLQLLVTWRRHCPQGRLRVHVQEADDEDRAKTVLRRFLETDHGMLAFSLAGSIWTRGGGGDLTEWARQFLDERFDEMNRRDCLPWRGPKLFALCLDQSSRESPRLLYRPAEDASREAEVLGISGFQSLTHQIWNRLEQGTAGGSLPGTGSFSSMLFELFRNTHQWARSDARNRPYGPASSARGIRVERHDLKLEEEKEMIESLPPLRDFFEHPQLAPKNCRRHFVELTVFDSGPGIAARRLATTDPEPGVTDFEAEHRALHDCLRKHITTSSAEGKGKGLHRVLQDLTALHAFLWLRCGRLSLFRDFVTTPYEPARNADEPFLLDWSGGVGGVTEVPQAAGSFFTALIPVGSDPRQGALWQSSAPGDGSR